LYFVAAWILNHCLPLSVNKPDIRELVFGLRI